jgi:uncharacterized repeat protein (TIGR02543 family)
MGNGGETPPIEETVTYTITFVTNGGSEVVPLEVEEGEYATKPANPKREGYKFINWYTDPEFKNVWSSFAPVTGDITVYAKWSEVAVVTPDPADPAFDREAHSMTPEEILAKYTLTENEVNDTLALLETMVSVCETASLEELDALYDEFEVDFYHIAQQMTLASIVYYCDMSDEDSEKRYTDTRDWFYDIQDNYTETCRTMYLNSPHRDEFFEGWSEEEIQEFLDYDPATTALKNLIDDIQVEYNNLSGSDSDYNAKLADCYVRLIKAGNELAALYGYENYYEYSTVRVYGRDYTTDQLEVFRTYIKEYIAPNLRSTVGTAGYKAGRLGKDEKNLYSAFVNGKFDSMNKNYLVRYLDSLGDTVMGNSMRDIFENENCVFTTSGNSHPSAFQTYLYEDEHPFCLFGTSGQTTNTMIHEIGHYYAAKVNSDINNYDLCETHSQGNEFLLINFMKTQVSTNLYNVLALENLGSAFDIIVRAAIIDEFEQRVYELSTEELETMTVDKFDAIMDDVCVGYGDGGAYLNNNGNMNTYWRRVTIDNPVYYVSYSISAVAAINIFTLAEADKEAAYTAYSTLVEGENVDELGFLGALELAGLLTPFDEEAYINIKAFVDNAVK